MNYPLHQLLASGVSMRRAARILNIHRTTVARKMNFLAKCAQEKHQKRLESMPKVGQVQVDDLITLEHTKCKPLAVSMVVVKGTRVIMGYEVSQIPASGHLAAISRKKYGPRPNQRPQGLRRLLKKVKNHIEETATVITDEDTLYPFLIKEQYPHCCHQRFKGRKGCVTGQGELKKLGYDPLFSINHTFAMLRANINRLFRRTWCTTKKKEWLERHLALYMDYHNSVLLKA